MSISNVFVAFLTLLPVLLLPAVAQSSCGTDQNPYCAGNDILEQLCCPYPNVCYWQDRDGQPGCCPAGQVCGGVSPYYPTTPQPTPTPTVNPTTITLTRTPTTVTTNPGGGGGVIIITTTSPKGITTTDNGHCGGACSTVTSYVGGAYSTVTSGVVGIYSTVTSGVVGVYSTVTSEAGEVFATVSGVLVGASPRSSVASTLAPVTAALFALAWNVFG